VTSSQLVSALASAAATDIALAPGIYDRTRPFVNTAGHRLYAEVLGAVTFQAGLVMGGNEARGGGVVRGVVFDVSDLAKVTDNAVILIYGGAMASRVSDVTITGNAKIPNGILARQPEGLVIERTSVRNVTDRGIAVDANDPARIVTTPAVLTDLKVEGVSRAVPRSSNGTSEACLWVGNTATVRGADLRSCAWSGLWTGTAARASRFEDVRVDDTPFAIYLEHFTSDSTFSRLRVGPTVRIGVICEWADPQWDSKPACTNNVVEDSQITSSEVGIFLDEGTTGVSVRRVTFKGQRDAAIVDYRGIGNVFSDNDVTGIVDGAAALTKLYPRRP